MACLDQRSLLQRSFTRRSLALLSLILVLVLTWWLNLGTPTALAGLTDDRFDGNIFALYAGNGSLVPPKVPLSEALQRHKPTLLLLYVEDSSDCKQYSTVVSQLQAFYGRAMDIIPVNVDSILPKSQYAPTEPGYYYNGLVPQTVVFNDTGKVVLNETGQLAYETIDDTLRQMFDLLPRSESAELKRRQVNEVNVELTNPDGSLPK
jgi:hypothetical protein